MAGPRTAIITPRGWRAGVGGQGGARGGGVGGKVYLTRDYITVLPRR